MKKRPIFLVFTIIIIVFGIMNYSEGAEENNYMNILNEKIKGWNDERLTFSKKDLEKIFLRKIDFRVKYKFMGYENQDWAAEAKSLWQDLPDTLMPKLKLTNSSIYLLRGMFYLNLPRYMEFIAATRFNPNEDLDASLFGILGIAQPLALNDSMNEITAQYIGIAFEKSGKSHHWPQCAPPPKK